MILSQLFYLLFGFKAILGHEGGTQKFRVTAQNKLSDDIKKNSSDKYKKTSLLDIFCIQLSIGQLTVKVSYRALPKKGLKFQNTTKKIL